MMLLHVLSMMLWRMMLVLRLPCRERRKRRCNAVQLLRLPCTVCVRLRVLLSVHMGRLVRRHELYVLRVLVQDLVGMLLRHLLGVLLPSLVVGELFTFAPQKLGPSQLSGCLYERLSWPANAGTVHVGSNRCWLAFAFWRCFYDVIEGCPAL
jgi:hypothetical protein